MATGEEKFTAVVLAGDRGPDDPLLAHCGVPAKAMIPIAGIPMISRVVAALMATETVGEILLCGPPPTVVEQLPTLQRQLQEPVVSWMASDRTPSRSAQRALERLDPETKVLLTTADHALLQPEMAAYFCRQAVKSRRDLAIGFEDYRLLRQSYPESRRTVTRLRDGEFCSCNLFAFLTPQSRQAAVFWQQVEQERKKPLRLLRLCGWGTVLSFLLGRLTLERALEKLAGKAGLTAGAVMMPFSTAAIDVDKLEDLELARRIIAAGQHCRKDPGGSS